MASNSTISSLTPIYNSKNPPKSNLNTILTCVLVLGTSTSKTTIKAAPMLPALKMKTPRCDSTASKLINKNANVNSYSFISFKTSVPANNIGST